MRSTVALIAAAFSAVAIAQPGALPSDLGESTYAAFIAAAEKRFPGPFDEAAFRRDHPQEDWEAARSGSVKITPLVYSVDGLRITGVTVRPASGSNHPVLIWARGGVGEARLDPPQLVEMTWWAKRGYAVVASNFRGAGGSEGQDEFGGADVKDLLALADVTRGLDGVDPGRMFGIGFSRGGMMLLRAAADGMPLKAIVTAGAPTDLASWVAERADRDALLRRMTKDYETERSNNHCRRSATCWPERIRPAVLIAHGGSDRSVPPQQAWMLANKLEQAGKSYRLLVVGRADHGLWGYRHQLFADAHNYFSTAP